MIYLPSSKASSSSRVKPQRNSIVPLEFIVEFFLINAESNLKGSESL